MEIVIDEDLEEALKEFCRATGRSPQAVAVDAVRRYLALRRLAAFRAEMKPYAEAAGFLTDEDVFRVVS